MKVAPRYKLLKLLALLTLWTLWTLLILLKLLYTAKTLACMPIYIVWEDTNTVVELELLNKMSNGWMGEWTGYP